MFSAKEFVTFTEELRNMSAHLPDAANANIIGSGATAATVATTSAMGVMRVIMIWC